MCLNHTLKSASLFGWFFLTWKLLIVINEMTQALNKAFKIPSLFKAFDQTPLVDYGNVLA